MSDEQDVVGNDVYPLPVLLYGRPQEAATERVRAQLEGRRVSFVEENVETDADAARSARQYGGGTFKTPLVVFGQGEIVLSEPSERTLDEALKQAGYPQ